MSLKPKEIKQHVNICTELKHLRLPSRATLKDLSEQFCNKIRTVTVALFRGCACLLKLYMNQVSFQDFCVEQHHFTVIEQYTFLVISMSRIKDIQTR